MKAVGKIFAAIACTSIGLGVIILIICLGIGKGSIGGMIEFEGAYSAEVSGVTSFDFKIDYGTVILKVGDKFSVDAAGVYEEGFKSEVRDGTWVIRSSVPKEYRSELFKATLAINRGWEDISSCSIIITLPRDFIAVKAKLELNACELIIDELSAETIDFDVDAGGVVARNINCTQEFKCDVGAGEIQLSRIDVSNADISCGAGIINAEGMISGKSHIDCGMGEVNLVLDSRQKDYSYLVSSSMGEVYLDEMQYGGINVNIRQKNVDRDNELKAEVGMGLVYVTFSDDIF